MPWLSARAAAPTYGSNSRRFVFRGRRREDLEREYFEVYHPHDEALPRVRALPEGPAGAHVRAVQRGRAQDVAGVQRGTAPPARPGLAARALRRRRRPARLLVLRLPGRARRLARRPAAAGRASPAAHPPLHPSPSRAGRRRRPGGRPDGPAREPAHRRHPARPLRVYRRDERLRPERAAGRQGAVRPRRRPARHRAGG